MKMENDTSLRNWLDALRLTHPLVIAGPCSAETEEQVLQIARELKDSDVSFYRAGIWKPRTRPNSFEGIGDAGLQWMNAVKAQTGLLTATEVANAEHVEKCLKAGFDDYICKPIETELLRKILLKYGRKKSRTAPPEASV